ncbi:hypothetical protein RYH80_01240 [Halobaculum sp. MBLA0147]|uniref:hypothetical protein n=1 Tax=Halobaculum sp. MBLA0147 TaxID=3079934 RepID=UPI0035233706
MRLRAVGLALLAGVAGFLLAGVAVTAAAASYTEFSVFLGIPAGLVAGVVATLAVLLGVGDPAPGRRRAARAIAAFGLVFVVGLVVGIGAIGTPVVVSTGGAAVVGLVAALVVWLRGLRGPSREAEPER